MKLPITIEFTDGTKETFIAQPPEFVKWEAKKRLYCSTGRRENGNYRFPFSSL
jgi:hypothetical protein